MSADRQCFVKKAPKAFLAALLALTVLLLSGCGESYVTQPGSGIITAFAMSQNELNSNRYTLFEQDTAEEQGLSAEGFEAMLENEGFVLYYKAEIGSIRLLDKTSGYVWGSLAEDDPENLNEKWTVYANSVAAIEYADDEDSVTSVGISGEQLSAVKRGDNSILFAAELSELGISFEFTLTLTDDGLTFSIDDSSISEGEDNSLVSVSFLPYFGATVGSERNGYIFIPDGCGALIRFKEPRSYLDGFSKRVFGSDYGIDSLSVINDLGANRVNAFSTEEQTVSAPVFGMVHGVGQNAFLAVIDNGAEYAEINADPAGIITDYNRVRADFIYRSEYEQPVSKKGSGVQAVQEERNKINPEISYYFLTGENADYVGMAKKYRSLLKAEGILTEMKSGQDRIPLRLDILVADTEKKFIGSSVKSVTSAEDIEKLTEELKNQGISGLRMTLAGWQKGGLNGYRKTDASPETIFGYDDLKRLESSLTSAGGSLSLLLMPFSATEKQLNMKTEAAITLSQEIAEVAAEDSSLYLADKYFVKPEKALDILSDQLNNMEFSAVLGDVGSTLYGEYLRDDVVTRGQMLELIKEEFSKRGGKYAVMAPNSYFYAFTGAYYDMPMVSSQYIFETDTVPFLQIVLSGSMELFAPYTNCSFYSKTDLLKQIDYNTYPSFILTGVGNYELKDTASASLQSTLISDWSDYIAEAYDMIDSVLSHTYGQEITGRSVLETGFVRVDYADGAVYINYTDKEKSAGGAAIAPQTAEYIAKGE